MRSCIWWLRRVRIKTTFPAFHSTEPLHLPMSRSFSYGLFTSDSANEHDWNMRAPPNHALQRTRPSRSEKKGSVLNIETRPLKPHIGRIDGFPPHQLSADIQGKNALDMAPN